MSTQNRTYPITDTQDKPDRRHDEPGIGTEDQRPRRNNPGPDSPKQCQQERSNKRR